VVLHPGVSVPTKEIFSAPELTRDTPLSRIPAFFDGGGHNDCLPAVLARYPEVGRAQAWLSAFGPAQLTGTGACLFARLPSRSAAEACAAAVPKPWRGWAVQALAESPERAEGKSTEA
jgi:4-diphosphocytidyl-2-C-methyl-D-erythritol kinase